MKPNKYTKNILEQWKLLLNPQVENKLHAVLVYSFFYRFFFFKKNVIDSRHFKAIPAELKAIILDY